MTEEFINLRILNDILREYGIPSTYILEVYDLPYESTGIRINYKNCPILITLNENIMFVEAREANCAREFRFSVIDIVLRESDSELFIIERLQRILYRTYCRIDKHVTGE